MPEGLTASLQSALADLAQWFESAGIAALIVGGVAASTLGRPRLTQDVDALVILPEQDWHAVVGAAARFGIVPRVKDALDFARRSRVLLLRHTASAIDLDIILAGLPFEELAVRGGQIHDIGGLSVRLPRVEDLLVMKAVAGRPRDLEDIRALLAAHPRADVAAARRWVREFAVASSMPGMLEEFDTLLAQRSANC